MKTHLFNSLAKRLLFSVSLALLINFGGLGAQSFFATGTYVGNGVDNRSITGVGFTPDIVIIKAGSGNTEMIIRTAGMGGDASKRMNEGSAMASNRIQDFVADGFEIGTSADVNSNTVTYYYFCLKNQGAAFSSGVYTGNGTDNRAMTGLGFQPGFVMIIPHGGSVISLATSDMAAGLACDIGTGGCGISNLIESLDVDGFTLGDNTTVNDNAADFSWFAGESFGGSIQSGTYMGNGADDRDLSVTAFQPQLMMLKANNTEAMTLKSTALAGDLTGKVTAIDPGADALQAFNPDGMQVGTDNAVNANGVAHYFIAFKENGALPIEYINWKVRSAPAGQVLAEWTTLNEEKSVSFFIERSSDGENFQVIKTVPASGNVNGHSYSVADPSPVYGPAWYRVKMNTINGENSCTESLVFNNPNSPYDKYQFSISPNPANGATIHLQFRDNQENGFNVKLIDIQGKELVSRTYESGLENNSAEFSLPENCVPGIYFLVAGSDGANFRSKVLIQD